MKKSKLIAIVVIAWFVGFIMAPSETTRVEKVEVEKIVEVPGETEIKEVENKDNLKRLKEVDDEFILLGAEGLELCGLGFEAISSGDSVELDVIAKTAEKLPDMMAEVASRRSALINELGI